MGLKAGIIGLPNIGKSTLFNAITKSQVEAANYPFATISPNFGTIELNDERVDKLVEIFQPLKIIRAVFDFCDIAGLVKGASKGEGLGNKFLANIREVDALCHVVRCFESSDIVHVEGTVDSVRDAETINWELIFADLEVIEKRKAKIEKLAVTTKDKDAVYELSILKKFLKTLNEGSPARIVDLSNEEMRIVKSYNLLTMKPIIYLANILDTEIGNPSSNLQYLKLKEYAEKEGSLFIPISAQIESELSCLEEEDKMEFLNELGLQKSGIDELSEVTFSLLGLKTFFTVGKDEVRAWTFTEGMKAPECAGVIHSDFQRGFIKAEIYSYSDLMEFETELKIKENGKLRIEGKEYIMKDGDVVHFRFNV